jgi:hypothetical protein
MKWIVFALGSVLAFGGLVAILQGYDIIEVERGWTLVISGATALSAGIVTVALGFVVARIEALITVSMQARNAVPLGDRPAARLALASLRAPVAEAADAARAVPAAAEPAPASAADAGAEMPASPDVEPQQETAVPDFSFADLDFRPPPTAADEVMAPLAAAPVPAVAAKARPRASFVPPPRVPAKSVPAPGPWPSEPAPVAALPAAPTRPAKAEAAGAGKAEHDWLDQALAGVEPDAKAPSMPASEEAKRSFIPETQQPTVPAVVGRYEANGASYVLFDDGSIEAETDNQVYHFASMAELKKFIEGSA